MIFTMFSVCHLTGVHCAILADFSPVQDPSRAEAAVAAPVDILFASFEKFLKRAWREHMGSILSPSVIQNMQLGLGIILEHPCPAARANIHI